MDVLLFRFLFNHKILSLKPLSAFKKEILSRIAAQKSDRDF